MNIGSAALLGAILGAGVALRVARFAAGDYYEDGAAHWWTAATAAQTGVVVDPFGGSTTGYWLPGYDRLAAALFILSGSSAMLALRILGVAFFLAAALALFVLAKPAGRGVALLAVALFAVSPYDIINAPIAIGMEPTVAFLTAGLGLLLKSRGARPALLWGALLFFALAALFRYEALPFIVVILVYNWWWSAGRPLNRLHAKREAPFLLAPLLLGAVVLALTWGNNFPSKLVAEGAPELPHSELVGIVAQDPIGRNAEFWAYWVSGIPVAAALAALGAATHFRRVEAWLVGSFAFLLAVFLYLNLGTASVRYLMPVEPLIWLLAALGTRRLVRAGYWVAARTTGLGARGLGKPAAALLAALVVVGSTFVTGAGAMDSVDQRVALHGPLYRAAAFTASLPQNGSLLVLIDSPLAAEASGLPAARMIGSASLPDSREEARAFLKARVEYVVAVNLPYYKLNALFPEFAQGHSTRDFTLLYDATGWEYEYSTKTAWVYRVNRGSAAIQITADLSLGFPFHASDAAGSVGGLQLLHRGQNITAPARGLGYPTLVTPTAELAPAAVDVVYPNITGPFEVRANFTLYPRAPGGGLDTGGARAVVSALYHANGSVVEARYTVTPPAVAASFTLRVNNSLPGAHFPLTFNDSLSAPTAQPFSDVLVWSLQNWIIGDLATLQVDYRDPALLHGGRESGGDAWLSLEAPANAASLTYLFRVIAPGAELYREGEPILLKGPLFRAGGFLADVALSPPFAILTDFADGPYPWVLEASGRPASDFVNASAVPATRQEALDWLRANVEYIVAVNRTGDHVTALLPELTSGDSTRDFSVLFDASGPPGSLSHDLVWVYRVNRGDGLIPAHDGAALRFVFEQDNASAPVLGLGLSVNGSEVLHPAAGLGLPSASVNGTPYLAGRASLDFVPGSAGRALAGTFWLYPAVNGTLDRGALPLVVEANFTYADLIVNGTYRAFPANATDNVTLTAGVRALSVAFPTYINDTNFTAATGPANRSNVWSIRNWLVGPLAAVQIDFSDPEFLYYARDPSGEASVEYEAPPGALVLAISLWVLPPALAPPA